MRQQGLDALHRIPKTLALCGENVKIKEDVPIHPCTRVLTACFIKAHALAHLLVAGARR